MSTKQDIPAVRTAADLERKLGTNKRFQEVLGLIDDTRKKVDSVESSVRSEIAHQATELRRDTEQIVMQATADLVQTSDFEEYKLEAAAQFKLKTDEINLSVSETKAQVDGLAEKIDGIDGLFFYIMYSEYADGHIMTNEPNENTKYMGTCSTNKSTAPIDHTEYTWSKVRGNDGQDGQDAILLMIDSSAGNLFKNSNISTTLTVTVIVGDITITDSTRLKEVFGNSARLIWQQLHMGQSEYTDIDVNDSRLSDNGFIFTLNAHDVSTKAIFNCVLDF